MSISTIECRFLGEFCTKVRQTTHLCVSLDMRPEFGVCNKRLVGRQLQEVRLVGRQQLAVGTGFLVKKRGLFGVTPNLPKTRINNLNSRHRIVAWIRKGSLNLKNSEASKPCSCA
jgi:hypothetical protein